MEKISWEKFKRAVAGALIILFLIGLNNTDNAVNLMLNEERFKVKGVDEGLFLTLDSETSYKLGMTLMLLSAILLFFLNLF